MYLSCLLINVGDNPDRPRPGRLWLHNLYHVHQRLCMAFPSAERESDDPDFLKPFKPADFGPDQVHVERNEAANFLFRIDPLAGGRAAILVQSALEPNWAYAFQNAGYLLATPPQTRTINPDLTTGKKYKFRLLANPTKRLSGKSLDVDGKPFSEKWIGKRVPVPANQLKEWLTTRAEKAGFSFEGDSISVEPGYVYMNNPRNGKARLFSARYEGALTVSEADLFQKALAAGIGPAKAFGFGLLSIAPVSS